MGSDLATDSSRLHGVKQAGAGHRLRLAADRCACSTMAASASRPAPGVHHVEGSFLIFLKFHAEAMEQLVDTHPGCLVATVTFQDMSWDDETRRMTVNSVLDWRGRFLAWLEEIAAVHPPNGRLELADLADAILAFTYGGMTLAKALGDTRAISRQALMFRETVRLHFQPN